MNVINWKWEVNADADLVTLFHEYLEVGDLVYMGKIALGNVIHLLKQRASEEDQTNGVQSLTRRSLSVFILTLPNMETQLDILDSQLRHRIPISREWGISTPRPEINIAFDPTNAELHAILQKIKEVFEFLIQFMMLVDDIASSEDNNVETGPKDVFWRDVSKTSWNNQHQSLVKTIAGMETFHADALVHTRTHEESTETVTAVKKRKVDVLGAVKTSLSQLKDLALEL
jgi:hypothetical protein